jgi:hypothetical protein
MNPKDMVLPQGDQDGSASYFQGSIITALASVDKMLNSDEDRDDDAVLLRAALHELSAHLMGSLVCCGNGSFDIPHTCEKQVAAEQSQGASRRVVDATGGRFCISQEHVDLILSALAKDGFEWLCGQNSASGIVHHVVNYAVKIGIVQRPEQLITEWKRYGL